MTKKGINVTVHGVGTKLDGITSISTSVLMNPTCAKRAENSASICAKCYARNYTNYRKSLREALERNTRILTERILTDDELPRFATYLGRFESFGDLINEIQVVNYFRIAELSAYSRTALWTKNPWIISKALKAFPDLKKPEKLTIVYSSPIVNRPVNISKLQKVYPFIDKVFTVFTKDYASENNIDINCGSRSCIKECGAKCYYHENRIKYINELLK